MTIPLREWPAGSDDRPPEPQYFFHDVLLTFRRHRWLVMIAAGIGLAASMAAVLLIVPRYTARASIVFDPRQQRVTDLPSIIAEQAPYNIEPHMRSEMQVLESEELGERVIKELGLMEHPEFKLAEPSESMLNTARLWLA